MYLGSSKGGGRLLQVAFIVEHKPNAVRWRVSWRTLHPSNLEAPTSSWGDDSLRYWPGVPTDREVHGPYPEPVDVIDEGDD